MFNKIYLDKDTYNFKCPTGTRPGVLYGLAKVHKSLVSNVPPFRPILSSIGTPTYNVAKFLVPLLPDLTINEYTVKDSFTFSDNIRQQNANLFMASLDVDSLFTRRAKSGIKMCHFVMVDFNKGINIIKHNFLKRFCNVGLSGTVLHAAGGSSSAHAQNMPANMRDPKNYNFNAQHSTKFFYFILIIVKKCAEKWYHLLY